MRLKIVNSIICHKDNSTKIGEKLFFRVDFAATVRALETVMMPVFVESHYPG